MNVAEPDRRPRDLFAKHARRGHARRTSGLAAVLVAALLLAAQAGAADWADKRVSGPFVCRADFRLDEYDGLFVELAQLQTDLSHASPSNRPTSRSSSTCFNPSSRIGPICKYGCRRFPIGGHCS